jgi:hypothetical protein
VVRRSIFIGFFAALLCLALPAAAIGRIGARPTVASNRTLANLDAGERLAALQLPPGSKPSDGPPAGSGAALQEPPIRPGSPNLIELTGWWTAPGGPTGVLDWLKANLPPDTIIGIEGSSIRGPEIEDLFVVVRWPALPEMVGERGIVVAVTATPGGATDVRLDSQAVWIVPRPTSERIPANARLLEVTWHHLKGSDSIRRVANARFVKSIASALNGLPIVQPRLVHTCPAESADPRTVTLRFRARPRGPVLAEAVEALPPGAGCGGMSMTIRGRPQPVLEGAGPVVGRLRGLGQAR